MRLHAGNLTRSGVALCMVCGLAAPVWPADSSSPPASKAQLAPSAPAQSFDFNLPAQPLASALDSYGAVTRQSVMFVDALVSGRTSAPVQGRFTPQAALNALLAGTGLVADDVSGQRRGAFVLKQADAGSVAAPVPHAGMDRGYDGLVQARVWEALCADARTAPGRYRSILQVQVTPSGRIHQPNLISSTGDGSRDAAILATLAQLQMDRSPPPSLAQPLTLVILPHDVLPGPGCKRTVH